MSEPALACEERRKLANLIAAIEAGGHAPASMLKAVHDREATIQRLEQEHSRAQTAPEPGDTSNERSLAVPVKSPLKSCRGGATRNPPPAI